MADLPPDPIPVPDRYNRRPTIDNTDDVDDEDGVVVEEEQQDDDLTLRSVNPAEITGPGNMLLTDDDTLLREDQGAVNVDGEDQGAVNVDDEDLGDGKVHL
jgi:hypothetical protein